MPCTYVIQPFNPIGDFSKSAFDCPNCEKNLLPRTVSKVKLIYSPKLLCECADIGYFTIQAQGGCGMMKIKCIGKSIGNVIKFSETINIKLQTMYNIIIVYSSTPCRDVRSKVIHQHKLQTLLASLKLLPG